MAKIGTDFSKARNAWRASATGLQPIEWSVSIIVSLALLQLGLPVLGQFFTVVGWSVSLAASGMQQEDIMKALMADTAFIKSLAFATFVTLIPTSILTAFLAYRGAGWRGGDRQTAIASHFPDLGWLGWFAVVVGFLVFVGGTTIFIRYLSGTMENVGEVEKTVQMLSTDKRALFLVPLAIGLFGPLTEELMFRGPFFSADGLTVLVDACVLLCTWC